MNLDNTQNISLDDIEIDNNTQNMNLDDIKMDNNTQNMNLDDIEINNIEIDNKSIYLYHKSDINTKRKIYINNIIYNGYDVKEINTIKYKKVDNTYDYKDILENKIYYPSNLLKTLIENDINNINFNISYGSLKTFNIICDYLEQLNNQQNEIKPNLEIINEYKKHKKIFQNDFDNTFFNKWVSICDNILDPNIFHEYEPQILDLINFANYMDMPIFLEKVCAIQALYLSYYENKLATFAKLLKLPKNIINEIMEQEKNIYYNNNLIDDINNLDNDLENEYTDNDLENNLIDDINNLDNDLENEYMDNEDIEI
jgi:hypothetical protein